MSFRMDRVNKEIKRQVMAVIREDVDDPALSFLSITNVETTRDLRESKVYFSVLDEKDIKQAQNALNKMKGFIRFHLGKKIHMKTLPDLRFILDNTAKYSVDIFQKIETIMENEKVDEKKVDADEE